MTTPQFFAQTANAVEQLSNDEALATITQWLNQRLRILISDQRSFEGWFKCVDKAGNIVLAGSEETRDGA